MKRWFLRSLFAIAALMIVAALLVWRAFAPPGPLQPTATAFALHNMTVVNPGVGRSAGQNLTVRDGLIQSIAPGDDLPGGSLHSLGGMYVLPGLADMHTHLPPRNLLKLTSYFLLLN